MRWGFHYKYCFSVSDKNACTILNTAFHMFSVVSKTRFHLHHHTFQKSQECAKCKYGGPLSWCLDKSRESLSEASQALMFCFGSASQEKPCFIVDLVCLVSPSLRVFVFLYSTRRELCLSQQRKWFFFFRFPCSSMRGNQTHGGKEFTIAEGTV